MLPVGDTGRRTARAAVAHETRMLKNISSEAADDLHVVATNNAGTIGEPCARRPAKT